MGNQTIESEKRKAWILYDYPREFVPDFERREIDRLLIRELGLHLSLQTSGNNESMYYF